MTPQEQLKGLLQNALENESARAQTLDRAGIDGPGPRTLTPQQVSDIQFNLLLNQSRSLTLQSILLVHIADTLLRIEELSVKA